MPITLFLIIREEEYILGIRQRLEKEKCQPMMTASWLNRIFHKNDGYQVPLVLSPYGMSNININLENELSKERLMAR